MSDQVDTIKFVRSTDPDTLVTRISCAKCGTKLLSIDSRDALYALDHTRDCLRAAAEQHMIDKPQCIVKKPKA